MPRTVAVIGFAVAGVLGVVAARAMPGLPAVLVALLVAVLAAMVGLVLRPADQEAPRADADAPANGPAASDAIGIEAIDEPALLLDAALRVAAANASARLVIGAHAVGEDLAVALRHPAALEAVRAARGRGEAVEREILGLGRHDRPYRLRVIDLGDGRLLLNFTDVSQARLAERMRVDFVANASHELRTPLATLLGFIETLQGPAAGDASARQRFLDIMGREAARMARLIDDLLSLSRIELDKYVRPRARIALPPLFAEVERTLEHQLKADGRSLAIKVAEALPQVVADRDQLLQVLHNLVSNALKYGRAGTPISLGAERIGAEVRVTVADQGDGIAPEHLPRLTERFYRVDASRSRAMGGTGLGLAIVKHIVERHRGRLEIDSVTGMGTRVSFTLPAA